jgi:hypothetical protein
MPTSATAAALQQAADGLTYPSETDARWAAVAWPQAAGEPTAAAVLKLGGHRKRTPVQEVSLNQFFAPLVQEQAWYGADEKADAAKYRALLAAVRELLTAPKVVQAGSRKVTVYVVGQAKEGGWAGLKTTAVET